MTLECELQSGAGYPIDADGDVDRPSPGCLPAVGKVCFVVRHASLTLNVGELAGLVNTVCASLLKPKMVTGTVAYAPDSLTKPLLI